MATLSAAAGIWLGLQLVALLQRPPAVLVQTRVAAGKDWCSAMASRPRLRVRLRRDWCMGVLVSDLNPKSRRSGKPGVPVGDTVLIHRVRRLNGGAKERRTRREARGNPPRGQPGTPGKGRPPDSNCAPGASFRLEGAGDRPLLECAGRAQRRRRFLACTARPKAAWR